MGKLLFGSKEVVCFGLRLGRKCLIGASSSSVVFVVLFYFFITIWISLIWAIRHCYRGGQTLFTEKCSFVKKKFSCFESFVRGLKQSRLGPSSVWVHSDWFPNWSSFNIFCVFLFSIHAFPWGTLQFCSRWYEIVFRDIFAGWRVFLIAESQSPPMLASPSCRMWMEVCGARRKPGQVSFWLRVCQNNRGAAPLSLLQTLTLSPLFFTLFLVFKKNFL